MRQAKVYAAVAAAIAVVIGVTSSTWADATPPAAGGVASAAGGRVTQPLRAEHRELLPHVEALAFAADAVGTVPLADLSKQVDESYKFLTTDLIPHAVAEDEVLYAKVDSLIGSNGRTRATDTMRRDHLEVGILTDELGRLRRQLHEGELCTACHKELRRVLYSLNAVVGLHFAKEEEVYLPLLDRELTAAEAQQMFKRMAVITQEERGTDAEQH